MSDTQEREQPTTIKQWAEFWATLNEDVTRFFDYLEVCVEEETDLGQRVVMQDMLNDLRAIVQASV